MGASLSLPYKEPDLAIWAHQAGQISGQALEAYLSRGLQNPACSSHFFSRVSALTDLLCALGYIVLCSTEPSGRHM